MHRINSFASASETPWRIICSLFRCIVTAVVQRRARSNDARKLARMPDRLLEDIGVTRDEIWRRVHEEPSVDIRTAAIKHRPDDPRQASRGNRPSHRFFNDIQAAQVRHTVGPQ